MLRIWRNCPPEDHQLMIMKPGTGGATKWFLLPIWFSKLLSFRVKVYRKAWF